VNSIGWLDEEPVAARKRSAAYEAHEPGQRSIRNSNLMAEDGLTDRIGYAEEFPDSWTHGSSSVKPYAYGAESEREAPRRTELQQQRE
jgi:hypothetical protein